MEGIQIITILFSVFMIYFSYLHLKRREFSARVFIIWFIIWTGLLIASFLPKTINIFLERLGISRAMDLFTIVGFIIIFGVVFRIFIIITKMENKIEEYVRKDALKNLKK